MHLVTFYLFVFIGAASAIVPSAVAADMLSTVRDILALTL